MARKLIIDCDPGQDDAVALLLAFASPEELEVLGVTTVGGNVPLELTQRNARMVCDIAGGGVPVYAGCDKTRETCSAKFNNHLQHGGFPDIPLVNPFTTELPAGNASSERKVFYKGY